MVAHVTRLGVIVGIGLLLAQGACAPAGSPSPAAPQNAVPPQAGGPAEATPARSPTLQALVDGARQEGRLDLIWGENTAGGPEGVRRWVQGLKALYGLNLDVQFTPGPAMPEVAARIAQEYQAGRPAASDVLFGTEPHVVSSLQVDALEPVDWASWAPNLQDARLIAPGGVAVEIASRVPGITFNSNRITGDLVPRTLEDVLKPEYKGRIAFTPYAANFDRLASPEMWGEQRAVQYVTKLADQVAGLIRCGEVDRLLSGEFDMLVTDCGGYDVRRLQAQGAPLGHVIPADAAHVAFFYMGVPRNAAHPNAAKLWIDYVLSRAGQDILYDVWFTDHYLVPGSKSAGDIEALEARGIQFTKVDVQFLQRNDEKELGRIRQELQRILQKK
jgi:iron(III) transport system substrate-binding protein